jgi:hypothetical protein
MRLSQMPSVAVSLGWQLMLVLVTGVVLTLIVARSPLALALGAAAAVVLCLVFLNRPDLGLLMVLLVRASTDIALRMNPGAARIGEGVSTLLMNPNVGLITVLIVGGGLAVLSRGIPLVGLPGGRLFALLLVTGFVGLVRSDRFITAMNEWLPVISSFIVYALAAGYFRTSARVDVVLTVLAASFFLPALFGFYQAVTGGGMLYRDIGLRRVAATFFEPNAFGIYLVMLLAVFVVQAFTQSGARRFVALGIVAFVVVLLIQTFSRVSWVGALVVLLTLGFLRLKSLLVLLPMLAAAVYTVSPEVAVRLQDPLGGTFAHRTEIWRGIYAEWIALTDSGGGVVSVFLDRLSGLGPGSKYELAFLALGRAYAPHNDYLALLVDYGVLGVLLYICLLSVLALTAYRAWRMAADRYAEAVPLSFLSLTIAYAVMGLTDHVFGMTVNQVYFWTLAGLTAGVACRMREAPVPPEGALAGERQQMS